MKYASLNSDPYISKYFKVHFNSLRSCCGLGCYDDFSLRFQNLNNYTCHTTWIYEVSMTFEKSQSTSLQKCYTYINYNYCVCMVHLFVFHDVSYEINNLWNRENLISMIHYAYIRMFMHYIWHYLEFYYVSKANENLRNRENLVFMIHYALATFACFSVV